LATTKDWDEIATLALHMAREAPALTERCDWLAIANACLDMADSMDSPIELVEDENTEDAAIIFVHDWLRR